MRVLSFKIPDALERKLSAVVKRRRVGKSDVMREALVRYLDSTSEVRRASFLDLAGDLVGCVKDAPPDLSSNPRHLADFGK